MVRATIVVREIGRASPDYSLDFDLPEVPRVGDYISIYRPDSKLHSEDLVVRHVWWKLDHPETAAVVTDKKLGKVRELFIECDQALGPHARDNWRETLVAAQDRGVEVVKFNIARFNVSEAELAQTRDSRGQR